MSDSTKNKLKGTAHQIKGAIKENIGRVIGKPEMEIEGKAENITGKIQKKVGEVQKVIGK